MTKSLSKAIALATMVGAAASAQAAINVNEDGLGEILLYSLYSVEKGNITNINITNTTGKSKAVKVRFLEGQNSQEVLDFNLYLSPFDQWSGAVTETGDGAQLISADRSCTLPKIPAAGVAFKNDDYLGDGGNQTMARTRVGHFEVIEMGEIIKDTDLDLAIRNKGCNALEAAFATGGDWKEIGPQHKMTLPTGGLYGSAEIMQIEESTVISYEPVALQGFNALQPLHARPGTIYTNINGNIAAPANAAEKALNTSPSYTTNDAIIDGATVTFGSTVEAISAVLARQAIHNNYVIDDGRLSKTNWVVSFPTKRFHVDLGMENGLLPLLAPYDVVNKAYPPFVKLWDDKDKGKACETIEVDAWNNDEVVKSDLQFSPSTDGSNALCYETNILTINKGELLGNGQVHYNFDLDATDFPFGWMNLDFSNNLSRPYSTVAVLGAVTGAVTGAVAPAAGDLQVRGLPVIGFSAAKFENGLAKAGVSNFYTSSTKHKATTGVKTN